MKRRWLIVPGILLALVIGMLILFLISNSRISASYGEKEVLTAQQREDSDYMAAWNRVTELTTACEESWRGKWPDWFGGFGVIENEGQYLVNVYMTQDTDEHRKEVCQAAGENLRAFTTTSVSWNELRNTLRRVDSMKSMPGVNIYSMGIQVEHRCVRVHLTHRDFFTTIALGLVKGPIEVVIVPAAPVIRSALRNEEGAVTLELGALTYSDRMTVALSTDAAFEQDVQTIELTADQDQIYLPSPGEEKTWYVRAKAYKDVDGSTYESEWSAAKTVRNAS